MYTCAVCESHVCSTGEKERMPKNCPCLSENIEKSKELYKEEENAKIAHNSALVEAEGYCKKTRLEETMDFANKCGYKNIGIAFCSGLKKEVKALHKILKANGFNVNSIICKNGSISKAEIGIEREQQVSLECEHEPMCNPIGQALLLNEMKTDLNVLVGLCVGHDSLFIKYSDAPVTVLVAKDRVLGHNPVQALYLSEGYYNKKLFPKK
ncbi:DUF1847 domain-containing protein [Clostridium aestuarii]|uniref:DUF1847 domain-containing protein n=1 Tax=Clostridium aestuarii TaxID=338193 RepID=A0ABT4D4T0_9CLOT|nr:DUF1847 domain-containing protein [Clostridium aestuarii]MCY6485048.1 DUF1847 domain-containing protein [Clostridium aestuarii]